MCELNAQLDVALRRPPAQLRRLWSAASTDGRSVDASLLAPSTTVDPTLALLACLLSASKVGYCVSAVARIHESSPDDKVVVFSQFTRMLDVLSVCLAAVGLPFERFDGSMRSDRQQTSLDRFDSSPPSECVCLLVSLHAGGVGLNLTRANHCLMVDTWYNPAVEQQAHDRVHRLSQSKQVYIERCVMAASVEQHLLAIQQDKDGLAQATLDRPAAVNGSGSASNARGNRAAMSLHALQQLFQCEAAG